MEKLRDLAFLLPGYELEGYPRHLATAEADAFLSGWLGLWHPSLIANAQTAPRWQQADHLPSDLSSIVWVLPQLSKPALNDDERRRLEESEACVIEPQANWREQQAIILERLAASGLNLPVATELAESLRAEFAALGYTYLQIQLMTRLLRYTSNLDQLLFNEQVCQAAEAALNEDRETAERMLQSCFDALGQERDHYYSLDVNLLDVTLLASTTLGKSLRGQLDAMSRESNHPRSSTLIASASLLCELREKHAETFSLVQELVAAGKLDLAGGLDRERPHPLMSRDAMARDFARGRAAYHSLDLEPPRVFSRLSYGLLPDSASVLRRWGFQGAFLTAWTEGTYPEASQAKTSWEAADGTFLPALTAPVLDVTDPASFLALGWLIGESLDHQHVPTVVLAHWPNRSSDYYDLLHLSLKRTPAFGRSMLAGEYFNRTDEPYHQERLHPGSFRFNWLTQWSSADELIGLTKAFHALHARCRSLQNLLNLSWQMEHFRANREKSVASPKPERTEASESAATEQDAEQFAANLTGGLEASAGGQVDTDKTPNSTRGEQPPPIHDADETTGVQALPTSRWAPRLHHLHELLDSLFDQPREAESKRSEATRLADELTHEVTHKLARQLAGSRKPSQNAAEHGHFLLNPRSTATRRQIHSKPEQVIDPQAEWNYAAAPVGTEQVTSVDVPSMGFVFAPFISQQERIHSKSSALAHVGGVLQNEFLEAQVDSQHGHLRSLHVPARRGNRLSVMLAHRERTSSGKFAYSEMIASDVRMLTSSSLSGLIRASGRLEKDGRRIGKFEIDYRVWRGVRVLEMVIRLSELEPLQEPNPWKSAYTLRVAWPTEAAILRSFNCGNRHSWPGGRALAPELIEIDETDYRTHYLTCGLAFHRRTEERFLETILACGDQSSITHRIGIGVDLKAPLVSAGEFLDGQYETPLDGGVHSSSGWLATVDVRTVTVDFEAPLVDASGATRGMRLFVSETSGKSMAARIRLPRELATAQRVDYLGGQINPLSVDEDRLTIALRAHEQVNVDVFWRDAVPGD